MLFMNMKRICLLTTVLCLVGFGVLAQSTNANETALANLVKQIQAKVDAGKRTEADFSDELKAFDSLAAKEGGAKTEEAAHIAYLKARLYLEVFKDFDQAEAFLDQVNSNYPDTAYGKTAGEIAGEITDMEAQQKFQDETMKRQTTRFRIGEQLADFDEKSLDGKPLSLAAHKGKVVLLDFWATWCTPCMIELPNVITTYKKFHEQGFDIIGVSMDDDHDRLTAFLKQHSDLAWPQYFDNKGQDNKLAVKYGIELIPFTVLLDRDGKIIGSDLRGEALGTAVKKALTGK